MSKNYKQPGDVIEFTAPAALSSGEGFVVGELFAVAEADAASGAQVSGGVKGVYELPSNSGDTFAAGDPVYWDESAGECVDTAITGDKRIGVALGAASAADLLVVRLDGIGQTTTP